MTNSFIVDALLSRHNKCVTSKYDPVAGPTIFSNAAEEICRLELRVKNLETALNNQREENDRLRFSETSTRDVSLDLINLLRRLWVNEPLINHAFLVRREAPNINPSRTSVAAQKEFNDLIEAIEKEIIYPSKEA